ncbi:MAG TPA: transcriptional regulator NrdR [Candidatus Dormibacteraeota bacterium]|jgi:transcriptional repressor NrdR|nr:transcriptional regulator NrdR [Candidatus Dormibacteraeota bacterium]
MRCPYCAHGDSKVVDSRDSETGEAIRRRRECLSCKRRFTTYERVESVPLYVVKKDGRREEFDRRKLLGGLLTATKKREVAPARLEALVEEIENALRGRGSSEIPSRELGELVMERLRDIDEIAYVRFASVYRSFKDMADMRATIEQLLAQPPGTRRPEPRRARPARPGDGELPLDLGK